VHTPFESLEAPLRTAPCAARCACACTSREEAADAAGVVAVAERVGTPFGTRQLAVRRVVGRRAEVARRAIVEAAVRSLGDDVTPRGTRSVQLDHVRRGDAEVACTDEEQVMVV
jgi:hypothetical protein